MPGAGNYQSALMRSVLGALLFMCLSAARADSAESLHHEWDELLNSHVQTINDGHSTVADYAGFQADRAQLDKYLTTLSEVTQAQFDRWSGDEQLAFLINAYNAYTVALILTDYPGLASIRELGGFFSSPWEKEFAPLLGDSRSLDYIEHTLIRGNFSEPRIHFAVNCASIGCPALREEAYTGPSLNTQLEAQTRRFLADRSRNRLRDGSLEVSKIFSWYREDFAQGWQGLDSLNDFLAHYQAALGLSEAQQQALRNGNIDIEFLDYNWDLNDRP